MHDEPRPAALDRRSFLLGAMATGTALVAGCRSIEHAPAPIGQETVNDVHSQLNPTRVAAVIAPASTQELSRLIAQSHERGRPVALCGGRHAGGGQQFLRDETLIDTRRLSGLIDLDSANGLACFQGGTRWPEVFASLAAAQGGAGAGAWTIRQKQGGGDQLSLGGAVSANIHGRGLDMRPFVQDIERLELIDPRGQLLMCSREHRGELFRNAVGGYGLFGAIASVTLRLTRSLNLARRSTIINADEVVGFLDDRRRDGAIFGDWQFCIDETSDEFLRTGVVTWYSPAPDHAGVDPDAVPDPQTLVRLAILAHTDKPAAWRMFARSKLDRQGVARPWEHWLGSDYTPGYHQAVDQQTGAPVHGSEALSEFYVPRQRLGEFLRSTASWLAQRRSNILYGVVRLIRRDDETTLAWARDDFACVILNPHVSHTPAGIAALHADLSGVLDLAQGLGGSHYLTYGRFASGAQLRRGYPALAGLFEAKRRHDPGETFQSDWYRHHARVLGIA